MSLSPKDKEELKDLDNIVNDLDASTKLTKWEKEPSVADLKQDLEDAKAATDTHVGKVNSWLDNLNVTGNATIKTRTGRSSHVPKVIRKQAEWRYAALSEPFLSTEDIFNTDPVTAEDREAAIQNGLVLNSQFNYKIQKVKFIDEYIRTAVDEGTVVCRIGWDFEEKDITRIEPTYIYNLTASVKIAEEFQATHQLMQEAPEQFKLLTPAQKTLHMEGIKAGGPVERIRVGEEEITETIQVKNTPTVEVCDYRNLTIDPSCKGDLDKARFIVYSYESSLAELKALGKFKNLNKINAEGASVLSNHEQAPTGIDENFNFTDKARKRFIVKEYWGYRETDNNGTLRAIVASWVDGVMIQMEDNPFPDQKLPFISAQYLPVRKEVFGEPDGELLEENQKIVGAVVRGMLDSMGRSANGQTATMKGALDVVNRRKFEKGLDYEYNPGINPDSAFYMHKYPEIPQSAQYILSSTYADAESLTGVKAFADSGISGKALGATATGIRSALDATAKRELGILRRMAQGIKDIGYKFISMNAEFLDDEEVVRITNNEFVVVRRDTLDGKVDLSLTISTAEADEQKASELSFMLQTMGNNMDPEMSKMILGEIATLRKMPLLAKKMLEYSPQPDPLVKEKQQLEVELLRAQISNEQAKAAENTIDVELKKAKVRSLEGKSDIESLTYLEKESGADKQYEMDKLDHNRGTELDLKALDSMLSNKETTQNKTTI